MDADLAEPDSGRQSSHHASFAGAGISISPMLWGNLRAGTGDQAGDLFGLTEVPPGLSFATASPGTSRPSCTSFEDHSTVMNMTLSIRGCGAICSGIVSVEGPK
jgi:hypothetical protein